MQRQPIRDEDIPTGFQFAAVAAGIKASGKPDVALAVSDNPASLAATFTDNTVVAAPVVIGRQIAAAGQARAVLVNAGNANACTGKQGHRDATRSQRAVGTALKCDADVVFPSSTGVIGRPMPMDKLERGIKAAAAELSADAAHAEAFAHAILTTDLVAKTAATTVTVAGKPVRILGLCKGSGMIAPSMSLATTKHATMLGYVFTDAEITPASLRKVWQQVVGRSFNRVTIDRDTSTNDTAAVLANGSSGVKIVGTEATARFRDGLEVVCTDLARQVAADGEGATKLVTVEVSGARSDAAAERVARAIADSLLVKTALHGNDPNWGRIIAAAGYSGGGFDPDWATLKIEGTTVFAKGKPRSVDLKAVSKSMANPEVTLRLACGQGDGSATVWTCDLSREYIAINADYTT